MNKSGLEFFTSGYCRDHGAVPERDFFNILSPSNGKGSALAAMKENGSILAAIHPLAEKGQNLFGDGWQDLLGTFRRRLNHQGLEDPQSSEALLLFSFEKPVTAITSLLENLNRTAEEFSWQKSSGPLPLQVVFHLETHGDHTSPLRDPLAGLWDTLKTDYPYLTHSLRSEWEQLIEDENLPPHSLGEGEAGLYPLKFADQSGVKTAPLFPFRDLPLTGQLRPCFYCGITVHTPSACPAKQLTMAVCALDRVGYLPIPELGTAFHEAFSNEERLRLLIAKGVDTSDLRRNFSLQAFVAYFDLMKIFQVRFLHHLAFSSKTLPWKELLESVPVSLSNHALHLAFDCLRVGQYAQAEELFFEESRRPGGRQFHATVGRAFIALEQERVSEMGQLLESASTMATTENEKIYISFLLSRCFELQGNTWKAEHALDNIFAMGVDCPEASYRQLQLLARVAFSDRELHQLRFLVAEEREYFVRALLDPFLLEVRGPVEDLLSLHLEAKKDEAEELLTRLQEQCRELQAWLAPEDRELQTIIQETEGLTKQFARNSYYDFLAVAIAAKLMINKSFQVQEERLDALNEKKEKAAGAQDGFVRYWDAYPYQGFFRGFQEILRKNKEKIAVLQSLLAQNITGEAYRNAIAALEEIEGLFAQLHPMVVRMGWLRIFFDGLRFFVKRLIITEIVLLLLCFISLPVLVFWLDNPAGAAFVEMVQTPWVQKQILFVVTLIVAPLAALAQTLWKAT